MGKETIGPAGHEVVRQEDDGEPAGIYVLRVTRRSIAFDVLLALLILAAGLVVRRVHPMRCAVRVSGIFALQFAVFGSPRGWG